MIVTIMAALLLLGFAQGGEPRDWVFGNHSDGSAYEVCAVGSPGCMYGPAQPIDVATENAAAEARLQKIPVNRRKIIIIPGRTPNGTPRPYRMNSDEHDRVAHAAEYFGLNTSGAELIFTSGGNVHPSGTPFNEAYEMKQTLIREFSVAADRIVIDPYARHSTTNLRNAGRFMLAFNISEARIITDLPQTLLFQHYKLSGFEKQCNSQLGYFVAEHLGPGGRPEHTLYVPSPAVWTRNALEPRDP